METEDLVLNHSCQRQKIKKISVVLPDICISIFPKALIVKTIDLSNLPRFMISAQNCYSFLEPNFQTNQKSNSLYWVISSINVVSHEQVVSVRRLAPDLEEFHQVVELPVNISANSDRTLHWLHIALLRKNFFCLFSTTVNSYFKFWLTLSHRALTSFSGMGL